MTKRLVVTGALGHIGSRLIREIPAVRFDEVVLIDNLSTQRYTSLFDLPTTTRYRFVEADICTADLATLFRDATAVIHLAAVTDATQSFDNRTLVEEVNVRGTERVARACIAAHAPLVFLSTTSVYGSQATRVDEDCLVADLRPQSPYAESKLQGEGLLGALGRTDGLRYIALRCGTIFGTSPGMRFHTAINKFAWQACTGQPLTVWETARQQVRPYLHIDDAVRALLFIAERDLFPQRIYNVVTANASVDEIVNTLREFVPRLDVALVSSPIMNQLSYEVSDARFAALGFEAKETLRDGIAKTVDQFRALLPR